MRICLAASGGGHIRQLLDLKPVWQGHDICFVTDRTALGESLARDYRTHFVAHFALGQAKLGRPLVMLRSAWANFWQSRRAIRAERPDVVISTGAGTVFFTLLWARLYGARLIVVESFARFDQPSLFMRLAAPLAHRTVIQSQALRRRFPKAEMFDPLRILDGPRPRKRPLLFATVGATLPFDRMIEAVAELKRSGEIDEAVLAQVGVGGAKPAGIECVETMTFDEMQRTLREADLVVCHGGTGSLITALREQCRTVVMPRLFERGEVYDDHQLEISQAFEGRGLVTVANDLAGLRAALREARSRQPLGATTDPQALIRWLEQLLDAWGGEATSRDRQSGKASGHRVRDRASPAAVSVDEPAA